MTRDNVRVLDIDGAVGEDKSEGPNDSDGLMGAKTRRSEEGSSDESAAKKHMSRALNYQMCLCQLLLYQR